MKIYGHSPDAMNMLINEHILPLKDNIDQEVASSTEHILQLMEMLKDEDMVNLLELIHQTLYPYFTFYSSEQNLISIEMFQHFCTDFKIFPDILPEELVINFFKTLSNFY
jgi:hypothetical protein